jgi:hypothetical protein
MDDLLAEARAATKAKCRTPEASVKGEVCNADRADGSHDVKHEAVRCHIETTRDIDVGEIHLGSADQMMATRAADSSNGSLSGYYLRAFF